MWRILYSLLAYCIAPLIPLRLLYKARRNPAYRSDWVQRFHIGDLPRAQARLWVHAVSVGEVVAASSIIRELLRRHPQYRLMLTTTTPTGREEALRRFGDTVDHRFLPIDLPHLMAALVRRLQPSLLIVIETELWPNLFAACQHQGVPVLLANARLSERSFSRYQRVGRLARQTLALVDVIAARAQADAERLLALGALPERLRVVGNTKWDMEPGPPSRPPAVTLPSDRPIWMAASTHEGEESLILDVHRQLLRSHPDALLVIAPRHPERFATVEALCLNAGLATGLRSKGPPTAAQAVWLADSMGELGHWFPQATFAFMGGSLVPVGGHNPLEPAAHGIPVLTGPHIGNFVEVYAALAPGALTVADAGELLAGARALLADPDDRRRRGQLLLDCVSRHAGAAARVCDLADTLIGEATTTRQRVGAPQ